MLNYFLFIKLFCFLEQSHIRIWFVKLIPHLGLLDIRHQRLFGRSHPQQIDNFCRSLYRKVEHIRRNRFHSKSNISRLRVQLESADFHRTFSLRNFVRKVRRFRSFVLLVGRDLKGSISKTKCFNRLF